MSAHPVSARMLSASVGIVQHDAALAAEGLISAADTALYRAKARCGGVEVARAEDEPPARNVRSGGTLGP